MNRPPHCYDKPAVAAVYRATHERRHMRHFLPEPLDAPLHENRRPAGDAT